MSSSTTSVSMTPARRGVAASIGYWVLQVAGWALYFWAQASGEVIFADESWSKAGAVWGSFCFIGFALTHLLRFIIKRERWLSLPPRALLIRMLIAIAFIACALDAVIIVL